MHLGSPQKKLLPLEGSSPRGLRGGEVAQYIKAQRKTLHRTQVHVPRPPHPLCRQHLAHCVTTLMLLWQCRSKKYFEVIYIHRPISDQNMKQLCNHNHYNHQFFSSALD